MRLPLMTVLSLSGAPQGATFQEELEQATRRGYVAAFRWLGNRDESRDACQEAAARALSAADKYDPEQPFYPWYYRILRNHCVDRIRDKRRTVHKDIDAAGDGCAEADLLQSEREQAVTEAILTLPQDLREILELRHFQDASYEEIASILGCPAGTVMSRLYRARKALRLKLLKDRRFAGSAATGGAER